MLRGDSIGFERVRAANVVDHGLPEQRWCCEHSPDCAVHQLPFDAEYAGCTCALGVGSVRHERVPAHNSAAPTMQQVSRAALGALMALEAGQRDVAARLIADLVVRAERTNATPAGQPDPPAKP